MTTTPANQPPIPPVPTVVIADINVHELSSDLSNAVEQVKEIQLLITQFIDTIVVRKNDLVEKETQAIKATIQKVHTVKSELDKIAAKYSKLRLNNIHAVPLGNSGYISLDPTEDRNGFYQKLLESYTWLKNLDTGTTQLNSLLEENYLLQSSDEHVMNSIVDTLNDILNYIKLDFPKVVFNDRYVMSDCCIEMKVANSFVVYIFFSGRNLSFVLVKSVNEVFELDLMQQSKHYTFKQMTDNFTATILKLTSLNPLSRVKKFVEYVISFQHIFNTKCKGCNKHLSVDPATKILLPPVLRNIDSNNFYHLTC